MQVEFDKDKVDAVTLLLLYFVTTRYKYGYRALKGIARATMDRLYKMRHISSPEGNAMSVFPGLSIFR